MAHTSLNQYLTEIVNAIKYTDGQVLSSLVSFQHAHVTNTRLQLEFPEADCEKLFDPPWDELVAAHIRCTWAVANHDFMEAYSCQTVAAQAFNKIFQGQKDENWSLPVLYAVCLDLRLFANSADLRMSQKGRGKPGEMLEKAADILMGSFRVCASDNRAAPEDSKKWGMLNIVNQLFKIYFKINKLHLCKPLIRAIDSLPIRDKFSKSQLITFRFYVGRKSMFDSDFKGAEEYLSYAFERCHRDCHRNKRLILIYLLPVKMLLGHMPIVSILRKYDLIQFADVAKAVRTRSIFEICSSHSRVDSTQRRTTTSSSTTNDGNLLKLNEALLTHEAFFIKCGVYLILEKLKKITYRNLFKKVYLILGTHQLPVGAFTLALQMMGEEDVDDQETQCILANLIYEGHIKGYISFQHQKLVVSKQNPFPPLASIL